MSCVNLHPYHLQLHFTTQKRRQDEEDNHPLEGSLKKRMKLFSGGVFGKKNKGILDNEVEATPSFIEISSVGRDDASVKSQTSRVSKSSYQAPQVDTVFENDSVESEV